MRRVANGLTTLIEVPAWAVVLVIVSGVVDLIERGGWVGAVSFVIGAVLAALSFRYQSHRERNADGEPHAG